MAGWGTLLEALMRQRCLQQSYPPLWCVSRCWERLLLSKQRIGFCWRLVLAC